MAGSLDEKNLFYCGNFIFEFWLTTENFLDLEKGDNYGLLVKAKLLFVTTMLRDNGLKGLKVLSFL